jgi:hypothetical protein
MSKVVTSLFNKIKQFKSKKMKISEEFVLPMYEGQSILNVPSSICKLLDIPTMQSPPLLDEILSPLGEDIENVIFILVDAMAYHRLIKWMEEDKSLVWNKLSESGILAPITSISPSTTAAATTTFWTGSSPSQHGIAGYEMWLKEYSLSANMILHRPITYNGGSGNMEMAGFSPESFISVPRLGTHLKKYGVEAHAFQHYSIANSGLSKSFLQDATIHPTSTLPDVWISLREMLESNIGQKTYSWVYWGDMDGSAHFHGPDAERPKSDFHNFSTAFEKYFLKRISDEVKKGTVVIIGADHGQITTDKHDDHLDLNNHPEFTNMLHINPTGENRLAYLHVKHGKMDEVKNYINREWSNQFEILHSEDALNKGLFGPEPYHDNMLSRLGDLILISKGNAFLWWANKNNPLIGRHGGLSEQEMVVPFLANRLG